jgi:hypothetical protein
VETFAPTPLFSDHNDSEALSHNIATVPTDTYAPTESTSVLRAAEHPDETVTGSRAVPQVTDIAHISERELELPATNALTLSLFQDARNVNAAGATLNAVGGDQINYAANPCTSILVRASHALVSLTSHRSAYPAVYRGRFVGPESCVLGWNKDSITR